MVDRPDTAELRTDLAAAGLEVDALAPINGRRVGNGLGVGDIDGLAALQAHIVLGRDRLDRMLGDVLQLDVTRGADRTHRPRTPCRIRSGYEKGYRPSFRCHDQSG